MQNLSQVRTRSITYLRERLEGHCSLRLTIFLSQETRRPAIFLPTKMFSLHAPIYLRSKTRGDFFFGCCCVCTTWDGTRAYKITYSGSRIQRKKKQFTLIALSTLLFCSRGDSLYVILYARDQSHVVQKQQTIPTENTQHTWQWNKWVEELFISSRAES